jgi:hypothetical protein
MKFLDKTQKLDFLLKLIEKGNTGNTETICKCISV